MLDQQADCSHVFCKRRSREVGSISVKLSERNRNELVIKSLEKQRLSSMRESPKSITALTLTESVRDILVAFPTVGIESFKETADMLLNMQILYGRALTPEEAGAILYSAFQPENREPRS